MTTEELIDEGFDLLEMADFGRALKIGKRLMRERQPFGYEITAQALYGKDRHDEAIATLEEGLKVAPGAWRLWQLLGNYSSDRQHYARAYACYDRALAVPQANTASVHYNYALALGREGRSDEALRHLDQIVSGPEVVKAAAVRAGILNERGEHDAAIAIARAMLPRASESIETAADLADLHAEIAFALRASGARAEALREAWSAIAVDRSNEDAQWLIREIRNQRSERAKLYEVTLRGRSKEPIDDEGTIDFHVGYEVVADDREEAIQLAAEFEPDAHIVARDEAKVRKIKSCGTELPKGVYWASAYVFFRGSEDE